MNETFKAGFNPIWAVTETAVIFKKKEILFEEISGLKEFSKPTKLTYGVWQLTSKGKIYNLSFTIKDLDRALSAIEFIKERSGIKALEKAREQAVGANPLLTGEGMYQYAVENQFGSGFSKGTGIKHFKVLEKNLLPNETPIMTFIGLHNLISTTKHDGNFAYALTNKRIIIGQWKVIGEVFQSIVLENINDITFSSGLLFGTLTIDSIKEKLNVGLDKSSAQRINTALHEKLEELKTQQIDISKTENSVIQNVSDADELRKFKALLDEGIISQEEFDAKKKSILGL